MKTFVVNTDNDFPVATKHIGYITDHGAGDEGDIIYLREVVENTYKHPTAPEEAWIKVLEIKNIRKVQMRTGRAAHVELVEFADKNAACYHDKF